MNGIRIGDPHTESPAPAGAWQATTPSGLIELATDFIADPRIKVIGATQSGAVTVTCEEMAAAERGVALREAEQRLRSVFGGIVLSVMPLQDKNRLRRLRGVEVKD